MKDAIREAKAALNWRGNSDEKLSHLDGWTFAKIRRVEEALKSLVKACESNE